MDNKFGFISSKVLRFFCSLTFNLDHETARAEVFEKF